MQLWLDIVFEWGNICCRIYVCGVFDNNEAAKKASFYMNNWVKVSLNMCAENLAPGMMLILFKGS